MGGTPHHPPPGGPGLLGPRRPRRPPSTLTIEGGYRRHHWRSVAGGRPWSGPNTEALGGGVRFITRRRYIRTTIAGKAPTNATVAIDVADGRLLSPSWTWTSRVPLPDRPPARHYPRVLLGVPYRRAPARPLRPVRRRAAGAAPPRRPSTSGGAGAARPPSTWPETPCCATSCSGRRLPGDGRHRPGVHPGGRGAPGALERAPAWPPVIVNRLGTRPSPSPTAGRASNCRGWCTATAP